MWKLIAALVLVFAQPAQAFEWPPRIMIETVACDTAEHAASLIHTQKTKGDARSQELYRDLALRSHCLSGLYAFEVREEVAKFAKVDIGAFRFDCYVIEGMTHDGKLFYFIVLIPNQERDT